jgi:hypothetical protein
MSSQSMQSGHFKKGFSEKMTTIALIIGIIFLITILVYPRIFSPSNIGRTTAPALPLHLTGTHP